MNRTMVLLATLLLVCCANQSTSSASANYEIALTQPISVRTGEEKVTAEDEAPLDFRNIDFKNLTYPITYNMAYTPDVRRRSVRLEEGSRRYPSKKTGGTTYDLRNVIYVDLNGDGRKEAVVCISHFEPVYSTGSRCYHRRPIRGTRSASLTRIAILSSICSSAEKDLF